jgi:hypothetical protein
MDPPTFAVESPLDNEMEPDAPVIATPVVTSTLPLFPLIPALLDPTDTLPEDPLVEEPEDTVTVPPVSSALVPAIIETPPPIPSPLCPTESKISPPLCAEELPVATLIPPESPLTVPVLKLMEPLAAVPSLAAPVLISTEPLDTESEFPLTTTIEPPVDVSLLPAFKVTSPARVSPALDPTCNRIPPATV